MYELIDFGDSRRLERFGSFLLDRPCPAAENFNRAVPDLWKKADARFERLDATRGEWTCRRELPDRWIVERGPLKWELKRTEFGHIGLFAEQAANWDWIGEQLADTDQPIKVLNLFAYTGGSTLAAAAAGAEVTHVDAARNVVDWARRNARLSGLAKSPIRWIAEDARKFVKRELNRGNRYDAVILDPPSYGHGPKGEVWRLSKHLERLLAMCRELTTKRYRFVLLTCHTPKFEPERLAQLMADTFDAGRIEAGPMMLTTAAWRELPSGVAARWICE